PLAREQGGCQGALEVEVGPALVVVTVGLGVAVATVHAPGLAVLPVVELRVLHPDGGDRVVGDLLRRLAQVGPGLAGVALAAGTLAREEQVPGGLAQRRLTLRALLLAQ